MLACKIHQEHHHVNKVEHLNISYHDNMHKVSSSLNKKKYYKVELKNPGKSRMAHKQKHTQNHIHAGGDHGET